MAGVEGSPFLDGLLQALEDRLGKPGLHFGFVEDIRSEEVLQMGCLEIDLSSLCLVMAIALIASWRAFDMRVSSCNERLD